MENKQSNSAEQIALLIRTQYSEDRVIELVDDAIPEYLDDGWEEEFESEHDAYQEQGRGEAEGHVLQEMIGWYTDAHCGGEKLETSLYIEIYDALKNEYDCLNNA